MIATIYDVAKLAGVSTATVSRVLNRTGKVAPKTEAIVKKAMEQLNFSPNSLAQNFAKMRSRTIGFIFPNTINNDFGENFYFTEFFRGINKVLGQEEYSLLLINSKNNFVNIINEFLDQRKIEGLVIGANPSDIEGFKEAVIQKKSIVYAGQVEGFNLGLHVYAQYNEYVYKTLHYFVDNGHKNIVHFGNYESKIAIRDILQDGKNVIINYYKESDTIEEMQERIKVMFSKKDRPTALFYESFDRIQPLLSTLNELNLKVPEDVSLISVEHKKGLGAGYIPQITNVYVPAYEMGKKAARVLLDYLNGDIEEYNQQFNLESVIIERDSVIKVDK